MIKKILNWLVRKEQGYYTPYLYYYYPRYTFDYEEEGKKYTYKSLIEPLDCGDYFIVCSIKHGESSNNPNILYFVILKSHFFDVTCGESLRKYLYRKQEAIKGF